MYFILLFFVCFIFFLLFFFLFFFFNDTATTEIYTLSLHDALPIRLPAIVASCVPTRSMPLPKFPLTRCPAPRSEEHTSVLQSRLHLVCRLLLEKKKNILNHFSLKKKKKKTKKSADQK